MNSIPTTKNTISTKWGFEFNIDKVKTKFYANFNQADLQATYQCCPAWLLGANLIFNIQNKKVEGYNFGVSHAPKDNFHIGVKHESTAKDKFDLGKFFFYFYHAASATQTIGTEFSLNWASKAVTARAGLSHKFSDDTSGKIKVDHQGQSDFVVKHKISDSVTGTLTSGMKITDFAAG